MRTKVVSVRLSSLIDISDKACLAVDFNGNRDVIPKSQIFGVDYSVYRSDAYWISAWILEMKTLTYSTKKTGWYNPTTGKIEKDEVIYIEEIIPEKIPCQKTMPDDSLIR